MTDDPYRVLGVTPDADEAVIRAAYLALMKRYHPDQGGTDIQRAQRIAAAYHQLATPERRAAYDRGAAERQAMVFAADAVAAPPPQRQTGRLTFFVLSAATAGLLYVALTQPARVFEPAGGVPVRSGPPPEPALAPPREMEAGDTQELARVAEREPEPAPVEPALPEPIETAVLVPTRPEPPRTERPQPRPAEQPRRSAPVSSAPPAPKAQPRAEPARVEEAKIDLKALERHQTILYNQSFLAGDEQRRARLLETRLAFLRRLEGCASDSCRRDVYLQRNQEVAAIMQR